MTTICLSLPTNLRCESLSQVESIVFLIPPVLEILFSFALVVSRWRTGVRHLFLAAEGFSYFALAVLDLLAHLLPEARATLETFKLLDIIVGTGSLIPLLFYVGFISSFTISKMIPNLPARFHTIATYTLILFIPVVVLLNAIGSLIGISYRAFPNPSGGVPIMAVGFTDGQAQMEWTFLNAIALALLVVIQTFNFIVSIYQLLHGYIMESHVEENRLQDADVHNINGIGWISLGIKLGWVESVLGFGMFARGGFIVALVRRIIRLLSRACLVIGVSKDITRVDDVLDTRKEVPLAPSPPLAVEISEPRPISAFKRLSREAWDAVTGVSADVARQRIIDADREAYQRFDFTEKAKKKTSVTVRQLGDAPPTLHMRFSSLGVPLPTAEMIDHATQARSGRVSRYSFGGTPINASVRTGASESIHTLSTPAFGPPSPDDPLQPPPRVALPDAPPPRRPIFSNARGDNVKSVWSESVYSSTANGNTMFGGRYSRADNPYLYPNRDASGPSGSGNGDEDGRRNAVRDSVMSASSVASDSLEVVRQISAQFPGLPPRVTGKYRGSILGQRQPPEEPWIARTRRAKHDTLASVAEEQSQAGSGVGVSPSNSVRSLTRTQSIGSKRKPAPAPIPSPIAPNPNINVVEAPYYVDTDMDDGGLTSPEQDPSMSQRRTMSNSRGHSGAPTMRTYDTRGSRLDLPWLENDTNAEIMVEGRAELDEAWWKTEAGIAGVQRRTPPRSPQTPTIGRVRSRMTPTATTSSFIVRDSEYVEHEDMPDLPDFSMAASREEPSERPGSGVRDSQVLAVV